MKMTSEVKVTLKVKEVTEKVVEANRLAMRDTVVAVTEDVIELSPWLTGNNRRSIAGEVSGMGLVASGGEGGAERQVDDDKAEGAVYSTSGYGGYLDTGTSRMPARPYFKPAVDKNFTAEKFAVRVKSHLGGGE
jgi:hypothetical protein